MELQRDIFNSARDGDLYRLKAMLDNKPDEEVSLLVSARTDGYTPLIEACTNGHLNVASYLIERGADVNRRCKYGMTALHECAQLGHLHILMLLVEKGANINSDSTEGTPLMLACMEKDYEMSKYLVEKGADVNRKCDEERTALHLCAKLNHLDILKLLLQNGAAIIADSDGETPLLTAALAGSADTVEYFIQEAFDFTRQDKINALEILGATFVDEHLDMNLALNFWRRAMDLLRKDGDFLTENFPRLPSIAACVDATEVRTLSELEDLRLDPYRMRMQALLVRERILGSEHPVNLFYIRRMGATYANDGNLDRSRQLWMYAVAALQKYQPEELLPFLEDFSRMYRPSLDREKKVAFFPVLLRAFERALEYIQRETKASETELEKSNGVCLTETLYNAVFALGLMCELQSLMTPSEELELMKSASQLVSTNPITHKGMTTLHVACSLEAIFLPPEWYNPVKVVNLLLKVGADTNALDFDYNTPLHRVAMKESCSQVLFDTLLNNGAHLDLCNRENKTPLQLLAEADQRIYIYPLRHLNLKCLCAKAVQNHKIPYEGLVHEELEEFMDSH